MEQTVLYSAEAGVALITLNRPQQLNSFNPEMHQALMASLKQAEADPAVRAIVLIGAGRGFCAGQDLNDRNISADQPMPDLGESIERFYNPLVKKITQLNKPVIAAVNGVAAGAGANLALACDIVIAAQSASFIQAFCKIGLVPDSGGTWILPRLIGPARAKALMLQGNKVSAEQAADWGMIWQCVADDVLASEAMALGQQLATQPTTGLGYIKQALLHSSTNTLEEQLDLERDLQRLAGRTEDYREGVAAFFAKRQPTFKGY
ncbi:MULTISPECIES: 2-(1,2-epoxy-1,2-dihydrophenyl)acetyl-CoA isomerase PaaG [Photobacterium]|uniref:Enoyl-CoA hydratase n=1 Tax=Photobacterium ganghwense TaxID=320778 RepID=A0A0J1HDZ3_9GAMM|nr:MULTISPECIES: 2-(1,2-epoxy-1,2-dihydrophenyl)acetyl-CoA isomerase PaaG [Photobacterium]KLV09854.1 enoyl-CoA hydratase [Photobacterium ganghwense]MBV1839580.1 2-(1,2-epoxy-1,2-dihydrophenyl)acetyl-CoA isomerase PaaG [Photobacterium ganghwense]PSU09304.1 2-(1,2-epoxy-1,2-dihydrophenyl)acetyl-CoA isomerase [Photobacterium ganghwense]QSV16492.1 2-(1,2-epoxy-1,2-dihydrophenyl)acetyl-CoA isomerase [Photobacterium ganghwense]